jgi:hypothetical protein
VGAPALFPLPSAICPWLPSPQHHTFSTRVTAHVWAWPADRLTTPYIRISDPGGAHTITGANEPPQPFPNCPCQPCPQHCKHGLPVVTTHVWKPPAATNKTPTPPTFTGTDGTVLRSTADPSPSWPSLFAPKQRTANTDTTHVCSYPNDMLSTPVTPMSSGAETSEFPPFPN